MTYDLTGRVVAVSTLPLGDVLAVDVLAGATLLVVDDAADFDADGGVLYLSASEVLGYSSADDETGEVFLTSPTSAAYAAGDRVEIWDASRSARVVETVAQVEVEGAEQSGDTLEAIVDHALIPYLPEGFREGQGEAVSLGWRGDDLYVLNIIGREPLFDGGLIDPETLPTPEDPTPTAPPPASPALTVKGTADGLVVRAEDVEVGTLIAYHLTDTVTADGAGNPVPFTPSAATLVGLPTRSTAVVLTELPDGSRLEPGRVYFLRAVASNVVGDAPAGPMTSGALDPSVVTDTITGTLTAGFALLGGMQVGQITISPDEGITVPSPKGVTRFPADGSPASFAGTVETDDLTVDGGLTLNGETNAINGALSLANVVVAPTSEPTLSQTWNYTTAIPSGGFYSLTESVDGTSWLTVDYDAGDNGEIKGFSKATGAQTSLWTLPGYRAYAVARVGSKIFLAALKEADEFALYLVRLSSSGAKEAETRVVARDFVTSYPGLGSDGSNLFVVTQRSGVPNDFVFREFTSALAPVGGSKIYTLSGPALSASAGALGAGRAPIGRGGAVVPWVATGTSLYTLDASAGTSIDRVPLVEGFRGVTRTTDGLLRGIGFNTYRIYEYPAVYWDAPVSAAFSWFDSDAAAPGGQHETQAGPARTFTPIHFSLLRVQTPPPADSGRPDDPDSVRVYLNGHRQPDLAPGQTEARYRAVAASGVAAPASNVFESASPYPGEIRSARADAKGSLFKVRGDGAGRWGDLEVSASGGVTIGGDTGWQTVGFLAGTWENFGGTYALASYRRIGKRVFLRGMVKSDPVGTIFTLPEGFRPPFDGLYPAIVNSVSVAASGDGAKTVLSELPDRGGIALHRHDVAISAYDIQVAIANIATRVKVSSSGAVSLDSSNAVPVAFLSLDGISFLLD